MDFVSPCPGQRLIDLIGVDTIFAGASVMYEEIKDPQYVPYILMRKGVAVGWLGQELRPPDFLERVMADIPSKRANKPEDIGNRVAFLASDLSSNILGQTISVDGGQAMAW